MTAGKSAPVRRGAPRKREAILTAARAVFGREGFTRTSLQSIAVEAGVAKRTIYNHFESKEHLFLSVIGESAAAMARTHTAIADRHLREITDLEEDLVAFALEWTRSPMVFTGHFALVRTIQAEARHIPPEVLRAWRRRGPQAFQRHLEDYFADFAARGLLAPRGEIEEVANHFTLLTFTNVAHHSFHGAVPLDARTVAGIVGSGVRIFLRVHGARS